MCASRQINSVLRNGCSRGETRGLLRSQRILCRRLFVDLFSSYRPRQNFMQANQITNDSFTDYLCPEFYYSVDASRACRPRSTPYSGG